jgi:F-type H+-transporting ATPase subunit gamma
MPSFKEYNLRIQRLVNTRKMTSTMKMISANKLRKAEDAYRRALSFEASLARIARGLLAPSSPPLLACPRKKASTALVLVITSDKGLCGGFNNNLNKKVVAWVEANRALYGSIQLSFCGRRGAVYFRNRAETRKHYDDVVAKPAFIPVSHVAVDLQDSFTEGRADVVFIAYNRFRTALSQQPVVEPLLPMDLGSPAADAGPTRDVILEPGASEVMDQVLPQLLAARVFAAIASNSVGEHGARMTAMDNATTSCEKLIGTYTLLRNRARQAAITRELIEIVAGADALS